MSSTPLPVADCIRAIEEPQHPDRKGYDSLSLAQIMERLHVPGLSLAVIHDFKVHWAKGYGVADVETGAAVDNDTLFQAASISKPVSAMALVKAAQDGRLSLDDDINSILKSWKLDGGAFTKDRPVTPRMLASHTSGLGDGFGFPGYDPGAPLPTPVQILNGEAPSNVGPVRMERAPYEAMKYSGGGSTVLQVALTDLLGRPFPEMMQETVLGPAGMTNSTFEQPLSPERDRNATRAHGPDGKAMGPKWHVYPELFAAGLWTTATDLAKLAIEVQLSVHGKSNRILSRQSIQEMLTPVGIGDFAVGFFVERRGQGWYFHHGGGNWGFSCFLFAHKLKGYGFAAMTNGTWTSPDFINEVRSRIERAYGWDSLDSPVLR